MSQVSVRGHVVVQQRLGRKSLGIMGCLRVAAAVQWQLLFPAVFSIKTCCCWITQMQPLKWLYAMTTGNQPESEVLQH